MPSPQPEPDSTTKTMESETSEDETTNNSMAFNPMQVLMMQQMMMHMTQTQTPQPGKRLFFYQRCYYNHSGVKLHFCQKVTNLRVRVTIFRVPKQDPNPFIG